MSCQGEIFLSLWVNLMRNSVVFFSPWGSCSRLLGQKSPAAGWTGAVSDRVGNIRFAFARRPRRAGRARRVERGRGEDASEKTRGIARDGHDERDACRERRARTWESRVVASRAASARDGTRRVRRGSAKRRNAPLYVQVQHGVAALDVLQGGASRGHPSWACPSSVATAARLASGSSAKFTSATEVSRSCLDDWRNRRGCFAVCGGAIGAGWCARVCFPDGDASKA